MSRFLAWSALAVGIITFAAPSRAALEQDLGEGLSYFRVTDFSADLPLVEKALAHHAIVLDLRNTTALNANIARFAADLDKTADARSVRLVLLSATTSPSLIEAVSGGHPGLVTLGARTPALTPDIALAVSSEDDRHAYDAFGGGTPLEKLLSTALEKKRFDEAALVRDRANGVSGAGDASPDEDAGVLSPELKEDALTPTAPPLPAKKVEPPPLIDVVLQRAVQLHRALLALKKI